MVWIYGGGYSIGSTNSQLYNGQYLAALDDVIVVLINYRLGPLGFGFLGPDTIPGNMGLMDQVEGLKWVKNNIENFGGDSSRITLFGESAGSFSISYHLMSPLSRDLFNNAIMQSGAPVDRVITWLTSTKSDARANVKKLAGLLKCPVSSDADMYGCLKSADVTAISSGFDQLSLTGINYYPVVDGYFLRQEPITLLERGQEKKTNILIGTTADEFSLFLTYYLNTTSQIVFMTGEKFSSKDFDPAITLLTTLSDTGRLKALRTFYETSRSPPLDHLDLLTNVGTDLFFRCPASQFSSFYSESNNVYLYTLKYRVSNMPYPDWTGVPHGYDLEFPFGVTLNDSLGYNQDDDEMSRTMMVYWTNFAKSGDPNRPEAVRADWPIFKKDTQMYMELDTGSKLASKQGYRRHQCAFVNKILPMIPKDTDSHVTTTWPGVLCPSGSGLYSGSYYLVLGLHTMSMWIRQQ